MQMEQLEMGVGMFGSRWISSSRAQWKSMLNWLRRSRTKDHLNLQKYDGDLWYWTCAKSNPVIDEVKIEPTFTETQTVDLEAEVTFEVTAVEGSVESYQSFQSADAVENGIKAEVREESLLVSYYTTSGRFKQAVKLIEDTETTLTIGEEDGDQLLFIVLRDGRGGVDLRRYEFSVEWPILWVSCCI